MKTVKQWIDTISDPIMKKKMIYNVQNHSRKKAGNMRTKRDSMSAAIYAMFFWDQTPEGITFWIAIKDHFYNGSGKKSYEDFKHLDKSIKTKTNGQLQNKAL
jgi:hypothetical protein